MTASRAARLRWSVPFAVVALLLGAAGLRASLANATPSLPELTAAQLLVKVAQADVQSLSGVVRTRAELGLPALPGLESGGHGELGPQALLSGENTLRVFLDGPQRQRVDLLGSLAENKVVHNGRDVWHWSSSTNTATHTLLPALPSHRQDSARAPRHKMPAGTPQSLAQQLLDMAGQTTQISVGSASTVAGRPAYDLRLVPKDADSLIERADLYVDSATGLPLRVTVIGRGSREPAIDVGFTSITFGAPAAGVFKFSAPAGAKVNERAAPAPRSFGKHGKHGARPEYSRSTPQGTDSTGPRLHGSGWARVVEVRGGPGTTATDPRLQTLLKGTRTVTGRFGSGQVITTRLLTVLLTADGRIFAGPVTESGLLRLANAAGPR